MMRIDPDKPARAARERVTAGSRKAQVSLAEATELARALTELVQRSGQAPDLVIGIANGGIHPASLVAQTLGVPLAVYSARRRTTLLKQRLAFARKALSSRFLRGPIYRLNAWADRWLGVVGSADGIRVPDVESKNVLLVDDCVDSGATVAHVRSVLAKKAPAQIELAVLCWTTKFDSLATHAVAPDYYVSRSLPSYPWSADNSDYCAWKTWLRDFESGRSTATSRSPQATVQ